MQGTVLSAKDYFKLCYDLIPHGVLLQKFKLASSAMCQHCNEVDGPLHFPTCTQANNLGSFTQETLSPLFFTQEDFSWGKVGTLLLKDPDWIFQQHPTKRGSQAWSSFPKQ